MTSATCNKQELQKTQKSIDTEENFELMIL